MQLTPRDMGWIEVVCGPMFSGKTEELIRRVRRAVYAKKAVQIFKPKLDIRFSELEIVSHSRHRLEATAANNAEEVLAGTHPDTRVVGIDEVQFFGHDIVHVANRLAALGLRVICAGLDQDFRGSPFGPMPELLAVAEFVTKVQAICMVCGNPAGRSQRLTREPAQVLLGATEAYEARCRRCHNHSPEEAPSQGRLF
jgi:thymidine kinase